MNKHTCSFCHKNYSSIYSLKTHQQTTKSCIILDKDRVVSDKKYTCEYCQKIFTAASSLRHHNTVCKVFAKLNAVKEKNLITELIEEFKLETNKLTSIIDTKELEIKLKKEELEKILHKNKNQPNNESKKELTIIKEYKFGVNDYLVPIREDGMINATALCKAGGKIFEHYKENLQSKIYLYELSLSTGIPTKNLFEVDIGGYNGTWVHRKVGYNLAQWISPKFAVQVSSILDDIFIKNNVELINRTYCEKLEEESINNNELNHDTCYEKLEEDYKNQINKLQIDVETNKINYQSLLCKHNSSLKMHRYKKFKETGPCFYIIESGIKCECEFNKIKYKFGIAGTELTNTIDDRLQNHRTLWPLLKVRFILFMTDVIMVEKNFKRMFYTEINPNGHEIIEGVHLDDMIERLIKLLDILSIKEYRIISEEKLQEYNEYVDTTVKNTD